MDINTINIVVLAYLGDAVYEVFIREKLVKKGISKVEYLTKEATNYVSAKGQTNILKKLMDEEFFSCEELDVIKRGRNYKRSSHPKNTDIITYKMSSGFEAMIGYLYLNNEKDRLNEIINYILGGSYEKENS